MQPISRVNGSSGMYLCTYVLPYMYGWICQHLQVKLEAKKERKENKRKKDKKKKKQRKPTALSYLASGY